MIALLLWQVIPAFSQNQPTRFTITGVVVDSLNPLPGATVMLLTRKDSVLSNFTRANSEGKFEFKNIRKGDYLLKTSFVSYIPGEVVVVFGDSEVINLGEIKMKAIAQELMEVVVRTAKAPLTIRGDTIEYNAASFKVPPGSTVEDLLRKLPGVEVDAEGNIKAQGQDVKKLTVDGKTFFGDDPKTATKNLPAEAITKVQVFNDKSEMAKATGIDDGKKEKTVNLQLKDEFKKGGFGKLSAGVGLPDERAELKANYNKFNKVHQFSLIGMANNTNQMGMSWNDYQDFRGAGTWSAFGNSVDFGFEGGGRTFYMGNDNAEEGLNIPIGGGAGRGFSRNVSGGVNYNLETKKTKISSSYFYNGTDLLLDALRSRESFLPTNSFTSIDTSSQNNVYGNHRLMFRFEQQIDSTQSLTLSSSSRMGNSHNTLVSDQAFVSSQGNNFNRTSIDNDNKNNSLSSENWILYNKKLKKKGRSFGASASFILNGADAGAIQNANNFFNSSLITSQVRQENNTITNRRQLKSSLMFIEPLSSRVFLQSFFNTSLRTEKVERNVFDRATGEEIRLDSLSSYYTNQIRYNRLGTSFNYNHKGVNMSMGVAALQIDILGDVSNRKGVAPLNEVRRSFQSITPNFDLNVELKNQAYFNVNYNMNVSEPQTRDLQPVIDNSNPLFIREGNPDLKPEVRHSVEMAYNKFNMTTFVNLYANLSYTYINNSIVYNQVTDPKSFSTLTKPENIKGGNMFNSYVGFGFPIKKTICTMNLNLNASAGQTPGFINNDRNETFSQNYNLNTRLTLTPTKSFALFAGGGVGYNKAAYSLETAPNQEFFNNSAYAETNISLGKGLYLNSRFTYSLFLNEALDFRQEVPIWNASFYKVLGKKQRAEIRLNAFDILNQNVGITQNASQNFVSREEVNTLARYFMLVFTYNMRGIKPKITKNNEYFF